MAAGAVTAALPPEQPGTVSAGVAPGDRGRSACSRLRQEGSAAGRDVVDFMAPYRQRRLRTGHARQQVIGMGG